MSIPVAAYHKLPTQQRAIVQILATASEPLARTPIIACLDRLGVKTDTGRRFDHASLLLALQALSNQGSITLAPANVTCHPELQLFAVKEAMANGAFPALAEAVTQSLPVKSAWGGYDFKRYPRFLCHLRYQLYKARDWDTVNPILDHGYREFRQQMHQEHPLVTLFNHPFDSDYLLLFPPGIYNVVLSHIFNHAWATLTSAEPLIDLILKNQAFQRQTAELASYYLTVWGRWREAQALLDGLRITDEGRRPGLAGWHATLAGHDRQAIALFAADHARILKLTGKRKGFFHDQAGIFAILSLIRAGAADDLAQANTYLTLVESLKGHVMQSYAPPLRRALNLIQGVGQDKASRAALSRKNTYDLSPYHGFFHILADFWEDQAACRDPWAKALANLRDRAKKAGQVWLAAESAELLARLGVDEKKNQALAANLRDRYGLVSIIDTVRRVDPWERRLQALITLAAGKGQDGPGPAKASDSQQRLVWRLAHDQKLGLCDLSPRLQLLSKTGKWSAGRPVALKKLAEEAATMPGLTTQDRAVCAAIKRQLVSSYYYGRQEVYEFAMDAALNELVGHPLLFLEEAPGVRIDLVAGEPELVVRRHRGRIEVTIEPPLKAETTNYAVVRETPSRYKVVRFNARHQAIAAILEKGLKAPGQAEPLTAQAIAALSSLITIHSDLDGGAANCREVAADPTPHLHLMPYQEGLKAELLVKPLPDAEAWYRPGSGGLKVFAEVAGEKLSAARDLKREKELASQLVALCPTLGRQEEHNGEYLIADPEESLELLLELRLAGDTAAVHWPQGESLRVRGRATASSLALRIKGEHDWFKASGTLTVDDGGVVALQSLLALLEQARGRFIRLDDGSFLALSEEFRNRLEELRAYGECQADGVRFSPLAALALDDLSQEAGTVKADRHWQRQVQRFTEVIDPAVPSTLQAELRDYQVTGFKWLAQLAHWGVGACLADDMGLGKTIQTLAALLRQAPDGPSLVVAPLSVLMNWQDEARRFAPTLNVIAFGPGDRQQTLANLQAFDLVICSFGLLQTEADKLAQVAWQSIVLDEAQAIKNMHTKRAKAATGLNGRFKVITTGTPVENHMGELWSLFDFITPGLLGSFQHFSRTFMDTSSPDNDRKARQRLKKLIQPFILRRLKSQVLQELPPRTEITMRVEMSAEEASLYEAQRRLALDKLAANDAGPEGQQQIRILAEIMRLRRLCCNPRLVLPESGIESSKLRVFADLLADILDNRHKALVFSQFVDHLTIIAEFLAKRGIAYQYLDGATPVTARKKRINAFQAGDGDVFLISLKAGGSGLNLTAADYVIHMDPWWNPAVEDQASDRAHRIGQQRPVTVYRLVMADSIEEQIIDLHQAKRALADSLLAGGDVSGKMSAAELLALLKERSG